MKKIHSKIVAFVLTLTLAISMVMSTAVVASAAEVVENDVTTENSLSVQPARGSVIYYPISGSTSGYFSGLTSSSATYGNIPGGTYYFDYSYDSNYAANIVIQSGSEYIERALIGDGGARSTSTFTLKGGTYTVKIVASTQSYQINKYYAYNLILN